MEGERAGESEREIERETGEVRNLIRQIRKINSEAFPKVVQVGLKHRPKPPSYLGQTPRGP